MAGQRQSGDLSLVPYSGRDNNEIVLRHNNALVVYDAERGQLVLRGAPPSSHIDPANCPLCRRPLRDDSHEPDHARPSSRSNVEPDFINPEYFRMLQESSPNTPNDSRPPSPRRRLAQPIEPADRTPPPPSADVEFVSSSPASPPSPQGISSSAFSQGYFKRFFVEEGELGRGGKGVVLLVKHVLDGVSLGYYACKRVPVGDDHEWLEKVLVEVQLLQHLSHQNLVSYRHVWLENAQLTRFGPSVPCAFMLQQYCNQGDLHNYVFAKREKLTPEELKDRMRRRSKGTLETPHDLNSPRRLSFDEIYSFFRNITSGLSHLHANGFIHRDLKPSNCLLHDTGKEIRVLVSDFGEVQSESTSRKSSGATGTISYCAPEVLRQKYPGGPLGDFTAKSDIFSLGMILYFMCFGRLPYDNADALDEENEDLEQLRQEIDTWSGFDDEMPARSDLPEKLYRFLKRLLSTDPTERPTADDILRSITTGGELKENSNLGSIFEDIRGASRISPIDSPSPGTPTGLRGARNASTSSTGVLQTTDHVILARSSKHFTVS
ncbi:MAG: putative serine/threonine-protein kinase iks1 [Piccolia ochrophora]|nr:MAG: putative serine/threonine-protein kinase iks1 [Piccolia ochrophora]